MSKGEEAFALHCQVEKLSPEREYVFAQPRRWRFDFAFPDAKVSVEIEGGTWTGGRHSRGGGMAGDMLKYNTAVIMGWKILRYTPQMVMQGMAIDEVKAFLEAK